MASSQTSLLQLPIFASGDVPKWDDDWNSAMYNLNDNSIMMLKLNTDNIRYVNPTENFTRNKYRINNADIYVKSFKGVIIGRISASIQTNIGIKTDDELNLDSDLFKTVYGESLPSGHFRIRTADVYETFIDNIYAIPDGSFYMYNKLYANGSNTLTGNINITNCSISRNPYITDDTSLDFSAKGLINGYSIESPESQYNEHFSFFDSSSYSQLPSQIKSIFDEYARTIMDKSAIIILNPKYCEFFEL